MILLSHRIKANSPRNAFRSNSSLRKTTEVSHLQSAVPFTRRFKKPSISLTTMREEAGFYSLSPEIRTGLTELITSVDLPVHLYIQGQRQIGRASCRERV